MGGYMPMFEGVEEAGGAPVSARDAVLVDEADEGREVARRVEGDPGWPVGEVAALDWEVGAVHQPVCRWSRSPWGGGRRSRWWRDGLDEVRETRADLRWANWRASLRRAWARRRSREARLWRETLRREAADAAKAEAARRERGRVAMEREAAARVPRPVAGSRLVEAAKRPTVAGWEVRVVSVHGLVTVFPCGTLAAAEEMLARVRRMALLLGVGIRT